MFPGVREVAICRELPVDPSSLLPSHHQINMLQGCPVCGLHGSFCCGWLTTVHGLAGLAGFNLFDFQSLPCLESPAAGQHSRVKRQLAMEPPGARLVLAHWQAKPGPEVWSGWRAQESQSWCQTAGRWGQFLTKVTLRGPDTSIGRLMGWARVQSVPGLVKKQDSLRKVITLDCCYLDSYKLWVYNICKVKCNKINKGKKGRNVN